LRFENDAVHEPMPPRTEEVATTIVDAAYTAHKTLGYLRLSGRRLGFLINFNVALLKQGVRRRVL